MDRSDPHPPSAERFFDLTLDLLCIAGLDGTIVRLSEGWRDLLGSDPESLSGHRLEEFLALGSVGRFRDLLAAVRDEAAPARAELAIRHRDGGERIIEVRALRRADHLYAIARDVTESVVDREHLADREQLWREMFEQHSAVRLLIDPETGAILDANAAAVAFYGYPRERLLSMTIYDINGRSREDVAARMAEAVSRRENHFEFRHRLADGTWRDVAVDSSPIMHNGRRLLFSIVHDVTAGKAAERELARSERRFRALAENSSDTIAVFNGELRPTFVNPSVRTLLGYTVEEAYRLRLDQIMTPEVHARAMEDVRARTSARDRLVRTTYPMIHKDGHTVHVETAATYLYDESGALREALTTSRDVSERVRAGEEKELLLQEINHRVKNNLAMVSSLINLKSNSIDDAVDLSDLRSQVDAIRIVHELLQDSARVTHVHLPRYLGELMNTIVRGVAGVAAETHLDVEDLELPTRATVALGLIVSEAATNAFKYGRRGGSSVTVRCAVRRRGHEIVAAVSNDGPPIPTEVDLNQPTTLGLRLIASLAEQLNGTLEIDRSPHPTIRVRFPYTPA